MLNSFQKNFIFLFQLSLLITRKNVVFLMKDAGISLRSYFKEHGFYQAIFIKALNDYTEFQQKTINFTQDFIKIGAPDWSLKKISELYEKIIQEGRLLQLVGLTPDEIKKCHQLVPVSQDICEKLSRYKITSTFNHCDFHDNNILIDPKTHKTTLIDLGEVEITHPFFSLSNALHQIKTHSQLTEQQCELLQEETLKPWLRFESFSNLQIIFDLIQQVWLMHHILSIHRIMESVDPVAFKMLAQEGRLARKLRSSLALN